MSTTARTFALTGARALESPPRRTVRPAPSKAAEHVERELVCRYDYRSPAGALLFQKERYRILNPAPGGRTKTFSYFRNVWDAEERYRKPEGADGILYNLPAILRAVLSGEPIHWVEGEKDADALIALGYVATTVHQGANKVTAAQAAWLRGAAEVYIWIDKDKECPEVGAHDAAMRHDLLVDTGCTAPITFLRAAGGWGLKDAADHIEAGYAPEDAVVVSRSKLAATGARYVPSMNGRLGYDR